MPITWQKEWKKLNDHNLFLILTCYSNLFFSVYHKKSTVLSCSTVAVKYFVTEPSVRFIPWYKLCKSMANEHSVHTHTHTH